MPDKETLRQKKKRARYIREGKGVQKNSDGSVSTHRMVDNIKDNPTKVYEVNPSIAPDKKGVYKRQSPKEAYDKGEMFTFSKKKQARKFAYGSWKKGRDKRDAMKAYRRSK